MLKQLTAAFLVLAFTASTFCKTVMVLDYYTHTAVYAASCINKAKPALHCNGKCQMMKKLGEEEKKDEGTAERKPDYKTEIFSGRMYFCTALLQMQATRQVYAGIFVSKPVDRHYALLRPPSRTGHCFITTVMPCA